MAAFAPQQPVSDASMNASSGSAMFTCLSCSIAYPNPEDQRAHYQTDLHRYNMKRRVAHLPPVRADIFNAKIVDRQTQSEQDASHTTLDKCQYCNKSFGTPNAYRSHMNSKKHKENVSRSQIESQVPDHRVDETKDGLVVRIPPQTSPLDNLNQVSESLPEVSQTATAQKVTASVSDLRVAEDATEEEIAAAIDAKLASSKRIDPALSCIFCNMSGFGSLDESLAHMSSQHSFFIPEQEYLVDKLGLLRYLSDKISIGNTCIYCNGRGKGFSTHEAARKHMIDKGHCKVAYDFEEDKLELSDFYDFTSSYPDAQWEDVSEGDSSEGEYDTDEESNDDQDDAPPASQVRYGDSEFELILPSGIRLGHRSLRRYYNQALRPTGSAYQENDNSGRALAHRLNAGRHESKDPTIVENRGGHLVKARNRGEAREAKKHISTYRDVTRREQFKTQVGFRNNNQKHFRDPLLQ